MKKALCFFGIFVFLGLIFSSCKNNDDDEVDPTTKTYTLTLQANGGTMTLGDASTTKSYSAKYGTDITLDTASALGLIREGYNFKGWSKSSSDTQYTIGEDFKDGDTVTLRSNTTFYAIWSAVDPIYYYVSATGNDSTGDGTASKPYASLSKAISNINNNDKDYIFYVDGAITDSVILSDSYSVALQANSVTIQGKTGADSDSITSTSGTVIDISVNKNVTLKNISIKGGKGKTAQNSTFGGNIFISTGNFGESSVYLDGVIVSGGSAQYGGGIAMISGTVSVKKSEISSNSASVSGGGIYSEGGTILISEDSEISSNTATTSGGGIYNKSVVSSGILNLLSGTISENSAPIAAGIYNSGTFVLNGGEVSENTATNYAGGIYNSGTLTISSGSVSNNSAQYAAGIYNSGIFDFSVGAIYENTATDYAGGIFNSGTLTINFGSISNNSAKNKGGGVYNEGTFTQKGGSISQNAVTEENSLGAGVFNTKTFSLANGDISSNSAKNGNGGGVANVGENAQFSFSYGYIKSNSAINGAGLYNETGTSEMISSKNGSGQITQNTASGNGGGVFLKSGSFSISAGAIDSYGKRISNGAYYYQGNKAEVTGNSWYKADGTMTVNDTVQNDSYSNEDVVVGIKGWIGISE